MVQNTLHELFQHGRSTSVQHRVVFCSTWWSTFFWDFSSAAHHELDLSRIGRGHRLFEPRHPKRVNIFTALVKACEDCQQVQARDRPCEIMCVCEREREWNEQWESTCSMPLHTSFFSVSPLDCGELQSLEHTMNTQRIPKEV